MECFKSQGFSSGGLRVGIFLDTEDTEGEGTKEHKGTRAQGTRQKIADRAIFITFFPSALQRKFACFCGIPA